MHRQLPAMVIVKHSQLFMRRASVARADNCRVLTRKLPLLAVNTKTNSRGSRTYAPTAVRWFPGGGCHRRTPPTQNPLQRAVIPPRDHIFQEQLKWYSFIMWQNATPVTQFCIAAYTVWVFDFFRSQSAVMSCFSLKTQSYAH